MGFSREFPPSIGTIKRASCGFSYIRGKGFFLHRSSWVLGIHRGIATRTSWRGSNILRPRRTRMDFVYQNADFFVIGSGTHCPSFSAAKIQNVNFIPCNSCNNFATQEISGNSPWLLSSSPQPFARRWSTRSGTSSTTSRRTCRAWRLRGGSKAFWSNWRPSCCRRQLRIAARSKGILDGYMAMDQYLWIPFLGGWTSINPSYFDVNKRGTRFWHTAI